MALTRVLPLQKGVGSPRQHLVSVQFVQMEFSRAYELLPKFWVLSAQTWGSGSGKEV